MIAALIILVAIPGAILGGLAARKGYNFFIWFLGGGLSFFGLIVGLVVLAFLPYTTKAATPEDVARLTRRGNIIGGVTAFVAIPLVVVAIGVPNMLTAIQRQKSTNTLNTMHASPVRWGAIR